MDQNKPVVINWKALAYAYSDREIARAILDGAPLPLVPEGETITYYSWEGTGDLLPSEDGTPRN